MPAEYIADIQKAARTDPFYPLWHIAPISGLLNDPCGLVEKDGIHYIFHQWFPAGPVHGLKHWYLLTTRDFVRYTDLGAVLCPDQPFDSYGCYTGTSFLGPEGAEVYYTGIQDERQTPCICHGRLDGARITDRRPIICQDETVSTLNFRDPCAFEQKGRRYLLVGAESPEHKGCILLYGQKERGGFEFQGLVDLSGRNFGYMLECPNYFETGGEGVLFFSPMGIQSRDKYEFRNVFSVVYAKGGPLDVQKRSFRFADFYEMDKGFDFYAPQTYRDKKGRQILFGWLGNSKSAYPTDANHWAHMLTLPRQIHWQGDRMVQTPLQELEELRVDPRPLRDGECLYPEEASFDLEVDAEGSFWFELGNGKGEKVRFHGDENEFCLDRSGMTCLYAEKYGTRRYARRLFHKQRLRILLDRSSLEIFADNGQTVFTSRIFIQDLQYLKSGGICGTLYRMAPIQIRRSAKSCVCGEFKD